MDSIDATLTKYKSELNLMRRVVMENGGDDSVPLCTREMKRRELFALENFYSDFKPFLEDYRGNFPLVTYFNNLNEGRERFNATKGEMSVSKENTLRRYHETLRKGFEDFFEFYSREGGKKVGSLDFIQIDNNLIEY